MGNLIRSFVGHVRAVATGLRYLLLPNRMTVYYPEKLIELPEGYRGLIRYYPELCVQCGLCAMVCPAGAMKMYVKKGEKRGRPGVNYQRCIFCGFCADICPQNALEMTKVHDVAYEKLEDMILTPEEFAQEVKSPALEEGAVKVKVIFSEERGLVHEPA
ncbi:MAG: NADH-quinone oxidoreductase subunit I [Thermofilum sp.]